MSITTSTQQEPYVRLLVCRTCKSIDELPPFDGRPEDDVLLQITIEKHGENHVGLLYNVAALHWQSETVRAQVIQQIQEGGSNGLNVFGTQFYETRMQFHEDAMTCYQQHARPKGGCPDFRSEKKRLLPGTNKERKDLGLAPVEKSGAPKVYLCDFCVVRVHAAKKYNEAHGIDQ